MPIFVVRVWVPDRPGALGAVASRIGAVRGDLVGIDILERGGGRAIDELVVELPSADLVPLLVREVDQVDGVDVEDVRPAVDVLVDPRLDALETAARLVEKPDVPALLAGLAERSARDLEADWAAVVDVVAPTPVVSVGSVPPAPWLAAFIAGSRAGRGRAEQDGRDVGQAAGRSDRAGADHLVGGPDDVAWADMDGAALVLVLGRQGRPFRARERRQLAALCRIADNRWVELVTRASRSLHPSAAT
ncbi:MAG: hypothetical protein ACRDY0_03830 [Acidimicrobiales bacterium]